MKTRKKGKATWSGQHTSGGYQGRYQHVHRCVQQLVCEREGSEEWREAVQAKRRKILSYLQHNNAAVSARNPDREDEDNSGLRGQQAGRFCTDHVSILCIILEQTLEWNLYINVVFINHEKATFNGLDRETVWNTLQCAGEIDHADADHLSEHARMQDKIMYLTEVSAKVGLKISKKKIQ